MLVQQINQILGIFQQTNLEFIDSTKALVSCVFDCFMPEIQDEVVKVIKEKDRKLEGKKGKPVAPEKDEKGKEEESRYVLMEPVKKITSEA